MNDRDRLIELIQDAVNGCARHWAEIIADHLLANGVIVPPCKVGQTIYEIRAKGKGSPRGRYCDYAITTNYSLRNAIERGLELYIKRKPFVKTDMTRWNKTVFLTKEEAEAELKKRGKENEC